MTLSSLRILQNHSSHTDTYTCTGMPANSPWDPKSPKNELQVFQPDRQTDNTVPVVGPKLIISKRYASLGYQDVVFLINTPDNGMRMEGGEWRMEAGR